MDGSFELIPERFRLPDEVWERAEKILPRRKKSKKGGRPPMDPRRALTAIFYVLRTGIQWNAIPMCLGASSTVHRWFQAWTHAGVFRRLWADALGVYDEKVGLQWEWQSMDGAMTKAPLGGKRRDPTRRTAPSRAPSAASTRRAPGSPSAWPWRAPTGTITR